MGVGKVRSVPATPDPHNSAKESQYKREAYRDTKGVHTSFCQEEGILLQKYRDRSGRCIAILFKSIRVRGRRDSPELTSTESRIANRTIPRIVGPESPEVLQ